MWIKIKTDQGRDKIIANIYRPNTAPRANLPIAISTHQSIINSINNNKDHKNSDIFIASDFNVDLLKYESHQLTSSYVDLMFSNKFLPTITRPTRISHQSATLIDHIFVCSCTKNHIAGIILNTTVDHFPTFYSEYSPAIKVECKPYKTRKINNDSLDAFGRLLGTYSWSSVIQEKEPENAFSNFFSILEEAKNIAFPEITIKPKKKKWSHDPWMTPGLLISCKNKTLFHKAS